MLDPIFKISEIASQEYSIELYIKDMDQEIEKHLQKFEDQHSLTADELGELKIFKVSILQ